MKAVIQRVNRASVKVEGQIVSQIGPGILTFLGVVKGDDETKLDSLIRKICDLRIFEDEAGKMNRSLLDIQGAHLIVSQFTLGADCRQGRRPSFIDAERPEVARTLYEKALAFSQARGVPTQGGIFQADMKVELENNGPATFILET